MSEMYFESLRPKLIEEWKKLGKAPMHLVKKKISKEEILKGIKEAKAERAKYIKKNPQKTLALKEEFLKIQSKIDEKKRGGKKTANIEIKLKNLQNETKKFMGKPLPKAEIGWISKEIKKIKDEIEKL